MPPPPCSCRRIDQPDTHGEVGSGRWVLSSGSRCSACWVGMSAAPAITRQNARKRGADFEWAGADGFGEDDVPDARPWSIMGSRPAGSLQPGCCLTHGAVASASCASRVSPGRSPRQPRVRKRAAQLHDHRKARDPSRYEPEFGEGRHNAQPSQLGRHNGPPQRPRAHARATQASPHLAMASPHERAGSQHVTDLAQPFGVADRCDPVWSPPGAAQREFLDPQRPYRQPSRPGGEELLTPGGDPSGCPVSRADRSSDSPRNRRVTIPFLAPRGRGIVGVWPGRRKLLSRFRLRLGGLRISERLPRFRMRLGISRISTATCLSR